MPGTTPFTRVRKLAKNLENVEEGTAYGQPALKVGGKMFACVPSHRSAEPGSLVVRMSFMERELRLAAEPDVYYAPTHYKDYPCVLARLARLDDAALRELLEVGWQFVASQNKAKRR